MLGVIPGRFTHHAQRFQLLRHFFHKSHGEAAPELVFCFELCCACSINGHFEKKFPCERDAGSVHAAPGGENHGLKLAAMPGTHLVVEGPFFRLSSLQEVAGGGDGGGEEGGGGR